MAKIKVTSPDTTVVVGDNDKVEINISGGGTVTIQAEPTDSVDKIEIKFRGDSEADTANIDLSTFSEDGLQIDIKNYDETDEINLVGGFDFYVDPSDPDEFQFKYIGADGLTYTGFIQLKDGGEKSFLTSPPPIIICFAKGSLIRTKTGNRAVEDLSVGDLVWTQSGHYAPVRWIGAKTLDTMSLIRNPHLQPIMISKDVYGDGIPFADLMLSPQHRVKVSDWRTELLFGEPSILLAVKHLVDGHRVIQQNVSEVTYYHIMFDRHELISSNGLISESLHAGDMANLAIGPDALRELEQLFPALMATARASKTAAPVLKKFEGTILNEIAA